METYKTHFEKHCCMLSWICLGPLFIINGITMNKFILPLSLPFFVCMRILTYLPVTGLFKWDKHVKWLEYLAHGIYSTNENTIFSIINNNG